MPQDPELLDFAEVVGYALFLDDTNNPDDLINPPEWDGYVRETYRSRADAMLARINECIVESITIPKSEVGA